MYLICNSIFINFNSVCLYQWVKSHWVWYNIIISYIEHVEWSNLVFTSCGTISLSTIEHVERSNLIIMRVSGVCITSVQQLQQLNMENCTFQYITDNSAALTLSSVTSANITQCNFLNNRNTQSNGRGGTLYSYRSEVQISNTKFYGNSLYRYGFGGAIYAGRYMTVRDSIFESNSPYRYGGAIYISPLVYSLSYTLCS